MVRFAGPPLPDRTGNHGRSVDPAGKGVRVRDAAGRFVGAAGPARRISGKSAARKPKADWREVFLARLQESSNITLACHLARVDTGTAYRERRKKPGFDAAWNAALLIGYELLESETLARLRKGELKTDERKYDIPNALRLLKAHAEAAAAERARQEDLDEQDVLDSIDAMIDSMRERAAANAAIIAEAADDAG